MSLRPLAERHYSAGLIFTDRRWSEAERKETRHGGSCIRESTGAGQPSYRLPARAEESRRVSRSAALLSTAMGVGLLLAACSAPATTAPTAPPAVAVAV